MEWGRVISGLLGEGAGFLDAGAWVIEVGLVAVVGGRILTWLEPTIVFDLRALGSGNIINVFIYHVIYLPLLIVFGAEKAFKDSETLDFTSLFGLTLSFSRLSFSRS
jgi:hypothetical protein